MSLIFCLCGVGACFPTLDSGAGVQGDQSNPGGRTAGGSGSGSTGSGGTFQSGTATTGGNGGASSTTGGTPSGSASTGGGSSSTGSSGGSTAASPTGGSSSGGSTGSPVYQTGQTAADGGACAVSVNGQLAYCFSWTDGLLTAAEESPGGFCLLGNSWQAVSSCPNGAIGTCWRTTPEYSVATDGGPDFTLYETYYAGAGISASQIQLECASSICSNLPSCTCGSCGIAGG